MQFRNGKQLLRRCVYRLIALAIALAVWRSGDGSTQNPPAAASNSAARNNQSPYAAARPGAATVVAAAALPGESADLAKSEVAKPKRLKLHERSDYMVAPPDVLTIEIRVCTSEQEPCLNSHKDYLVGPDGDVKLGGRFNPVVVANLTTEEIRSKIERALQTAYPDSVTAQVSVSVRAPNSHAYYVIEQGASAGDQATRLTAGGDETIVDALVGSVGVARLADKAIWIARPAPGSRAADIIIPVSWPQIAKGDPAACGQQIFSGDRIFVTAPWSIGQIVRWVGQQGHNLVAAFSL